MSTKTDPRTTWWFWRPVQERLITFALALVSPLHGARYSVQLQAKGTGYHDPVRHEIHVNPNLFPTESPDTQFRATQGLLAHEAGHALFTECWPDADDNVLCQMVNILEDERMERIVKQFYPGIAPAIDLLGDLMLARQRSPSPEAKWQAFACCLVWRWAHTRITERAMLKQLAITPAGRELWRAVKTHVESAWSQRNTAGVIPLARDILAQLGIPPRAPALTVLLPFSTLSGVPTTRAQPTLDASIPPDIQPGLGLARVEDAPAVGADEFLKPEPYTALEDAARPLAQQLADALKQPEPDTHPQPHAWRGRFAFRQEIRTPDTPCLHAQDIARTPRSVVLYVLVDRSSSMSISEPDVQRTLMTLYLAATDLALPIGLAAFGANHDEPVSQFVMPLTDTMHARAEESVKALIAGYRGTTNQEFLAWGLRWAEQALATRPERLKLLVVIHDGQPVYNGRRGNDWELSLRQLRQLESAGITPIGVYLGHDGDDERQLRQLFRWLVVCDSERLPERLGDLLRNLL